MNSLDVTQEDADFGIEAAETETFQGTLRIGQNECVDWDKKSQVFAWTSSGMRLANEDGYYFSEDGKVLGVADGMGGREQGVRAAQAALEGLARRAGNPGRRMVDIGVSLFDLFRNGKVATACSTLLGLRAQASRDGQENWIELIQLGDGSALMINPKSRMYRRLGLAQNHAHYIAYSEDEYWRKYLITILAPYLDQYLIERSLTIGMARELYCKVSPRSRYLSGHLGDPQVYFEDEVPQPSSKISCCRKGTIIILKSDGIDEVVTEYETAEIFLNNPFEEACRRFVEFIKSRQAVLKPLYERLGKGISVDPSEFPVLTYGVLNGQVVKIRLAPLSEEVEASAGKEVGVSSNKPASSYECDNSTFVARLL